MIQVILENLLVGFVGLALLFYVGGGLSFWLPTRLSPYRWLIAPWVGYSLLVVVTQFLTNSPFALTALQSALVTVGLASVFWIMRGPKSKIGVPSGPPKSKINWPLGLLAAATFVLCVLPLWS